MKHLKKLLLLLAAALCTWLPDVGDLYASGKNGYVGASLPADFRPFNELSPWNTPIPENPEIDIFSDKMIKHLKFKAKILKCNTNEWSVPLHVIDYKSCPKRKVRALSEYFNEELDPSNVKIAENIPLPEGIWADPQTDGHMLLVDPKLRMSWDFSRAERLPDGSWATSGLTMWDLNGPGYRKPFTGKLWWCFGVRGSGFPLIAGLIRIEEIEKGEIQHALVFASPINRKASASDLPEEVCSPPASKTDGEGIGFDFIPEGVRLQLDPTLDLDSLKISSATKVIAKAMQKYGMYNGDNSADFNIYFQNLGADSGKWKKYDYFRDLQNIPIEKFRVLKCNLVSNFRGK